MKTMMAYLTISRIESDLSGGVAIFGVQITGEELETGVYVPDNVLGGRELAVGDSVKARVEPGLDGDGMLRAAGLVKALPLDMTIGAMWGDFSDGGALIVDEGLRLDDAVYVPKQALGDMKVAVGERVRVAVLLASDGRGWHRLALSLSKVSEVMGGKPAVICVALGVRDRMR